MTKTVKTKDRKISVLILLTASEIEFLDRKVDFKDPERSSRSMIIRHLVRKAMAKPSLLEID